MKRPPRTELSPTEQKDWEKNIQLACLKGLAQQPLQIDDLVFHGGTSLRFSWGSPRFSEDLDFMLTKSKMPQVNKIVYTAMQVVREELQNLDPDFEINIKEKSRRDGQLQTYMISLQKKNVMGAARVKLEFWEVDNSFFEKYKTSLKTPQDKFSETRIYSESLLPVADLKSAYCDKLVALSTRPFLKWRDIFDIWWLRTQNDLNPLKEEGFLDFFKHNLSAYSVPEGMTLEQSLNRYLNWDRAEILKKSEEDLQKWLSKNLWDKLYPKTVEEMIDLVEKDVASLLLALSNDHNPSQGPKQKGVL